MMKYFSLFFAPFLLLIITITFAAGNSASVSWIAPTAYSDASPLPLTDIAFYTVSWDKTSQQVNAPALSVAITVPCGSTNFSVTVTTKSTAKYPSVTSSPAGPVPYATGIACVPNPPTGLAVQ